MWPISHAELESTGIQVTKEAYGQHMTVAPREYNLLYCRLNDSEGPAAMVGRSKSGNIFMYKSGSVTHYSGRWGTDSVQVCVDAGINIPDTSHRDWMYDMGVWKSFL